ncbi:hypothetical protein [Streptomyces sp. NPDC048252]
MTTVRPGPDTAPIRVRTPSNEKFGGDSVPETRRNARAYLDHLQVR